MGNQVSRRFYQKWIEEELSEGANIDYQSLEDGWTLLHIAACTGDKVAVEELLQKGAKVDIPDKNGITPLQLSLLQGSTDMVQAMIRDKSALKHFEQSAQFLLSDPYRTPDRSQSPNPSFQYLLPPKTSPVPTEVIPVKMLSKAQGVEEDGPSKETNPSSNLTSTYEFQSSKIRESPGRNISLTDPNVVKQGRWIVSSGSDTQSSHDAKEDSSSISTSPHTSLDAMWEPYINSSSSDDVDGDDNELLVLAPSIARSVVEVEKPAPRESIVFAPSVESISPENVVLSPPLDVHRPKEVIEPQSSSGNSDPDAKEGEHSVLEETSENAKMANVISPLPKRSVLLASGEDLDDDYYSFDESMIQTSDKCYKSLELESNDDTENVKDGNPSPALGDAGNEDGSASKGWFGSFLRSFYPKYFSGSSTILDVTPSQDPSKQTDHSSDNKDAEVVIPSISSQSIVASSSMLASDSGVVSFEMSELRSELQRLREQVFKDQRERLLLKSTIDDVRNELLSSERFPSPPPPSPSSAAIVLPPSSNSIHKLQHISENSTLLVPTSPPPNTPPTQGTVAESAPPLINPPLLGLPLPQSSGAVSPPPPPPPPPVGFENILRSKTKSPKPPAKTEIEVDKELKLILQEYCSSAKILSRVVENWHKIFPANKDTGNNEATRSSKRSKRDSLRFMVFEYPFLIGNFPFKPKTALRRMNIWEKKLFKDLPIIEARKWRKKKCIEMFKLDTKESIMREIDITKRVIEKAKRDAIIAKEKQKNQQNMGDVISQLMKALDEKKQSEEKKLEEDALRQMELEMEEEYDESEEDDDY